SALRGKVAPSTSIGSTGRSWGRSLEVGWVGRELGEVLGLGSPVGEVDTPPWVNGSAELPASGRTTCQATTPHTPATGSARAPPASPSTGADLSERAGGCGGWPVAGYPPGVPPGYPAWAPPGAYPGGAPYPVGALVGTG